MASGLTTMWVLPGSAPGAAAVCAGLVAPWPHPTDNRNARAAAFLRAHEGSRLQAPSRCIGPHRTANARTPPGIDLTPRCRAKTADLRCRAAQAAGALVARPTLAAGA